MNITNFVQTGGFGVKCERLQEMQTAYAIFNQLGHLAGQYAILAGCNVVGTNVSNGHVVIDGEVLPFSGGVLAANVIVVQEAFSKEFENGEMKDVHFIRTAAFGTADNSIPWVLFKRVDPIITLMTRLNVLEKKTAVFQSGGGMVLWNKPANQIPVGWAEVLNWRGRIPVGMDVTQTEFNTLGKVGGSKVTNVSIPITGYGSGGVTSGNPSGQLLVSSGQAEQGEFFESIRRANANPAVSNIPVLNPYRTVLFIEYTV